MVTTHSFRATDRPPNDSLDFAAFVPCNQLQETASRPVTGKPSSICDAGRPAHQSAASDTYAQSWPRGWHQARTEKRTNLSSSIR